MKQSLMVMFTILCAEVHTQVHAQTLTCQVNGGVVSCPPVACPGDQVTFKSTVQNLVGSNLWVLPNGTCSNSTPPDSIALTQTAGACKGTTMTCGPYTATNADPGASNPCLTSTLTVTATSSMTSSVIQVGTRSLGGQNTIVNITQITVIAPPGPVGNITLNSPSLDQLTVAWAPPTTGGVPTSYNVSINDSSSPVVIPDNGSSLYTHTFTGLTSDTLYTVSVVAINCAGTSSVTSANRRTLAASPASVQVVLVVNPDNTSLLLNVSWTPVGGSVTMYTVRVVTVGGISVGQGYATCTSSPCLYVQNVTGFATNASYYIFVASINGDGALGPESTTIYGTAPTVTPNTTSTPTPAAKREVAASLPAIIGGCIGGFLVVMVVSIVVIILTVGCVVKRTGKASLVRIMRAHESTSGSPRTPLDSVILSTLQDEVFCGKTDQILGASRGGYEDIDLFRNAVARPSGLSPAFVLETTAQQKTCRPIYAVPDRTKKVTNIAATSTPPLPSPPPQGGGAPGGVYDDIVVVRAAMLGGGATAVGITSSAALPNIAQQYAVPDRMVKVMSTVGTPPLPPPLKEGDDEMPTAMYALLGHAEEEEEVQRGRGGTLEAIFPCESGASNTCTHTQSQPKAPVTGDLYSTIQSRRMTNQSEISDWAPDAVKHIL